MLVVTIFLSLAGIGAALLYALRGWQTAEREKREANHQRGLAQDSANEAHEQRQVALEQEQERTGSSSSRSSARPRPRRARPRPRRASISAASPPAGSNGTMPITAGRRTSSTSACPRRRRKSSPGLADQARQELLPSTNPDVTAQDHRGWEWYFLQGLLHADLRTLASPQQEVSLNALRWSRTGECLLTAGGNPYAKNRGTVGLREAESFRRLAFWEFPSNIRNMDVLADDAHVVCQFWDGIVRVIRIGDHKVVRTFDGGFADLACLPISHPNTNALALVNAKGVQVLNALTGQRQLTIPLSRPPTHYHSLAVHPDGKTLAVNQGSQVQLVDTTTGQTVRTLTQPHVNSVSNPAFSPDGKLLAVGNNNQAIVWDLQTGQVQYTLSGHRAAVAAVAFSPDCIHLATGSADSTVRVWTTITGQEEQVLIGHQGRVRVLLYHPSGRSLISGSEQLAEIKVWDMTRTQEGVAVALQNHQFATPDEAIAFTPDSRRLLRWVGAWRATWKCATRPAAHRWRSAPCLFATSGARRACVRSFPTGARNGWRLSSATRKASLSSTWTPGAACNACVFPIRLCSSPMDAAGKRLAVAAWVRLPARWSASWPCTTSRPGKRWSGSSRWPRLTSAQGFTACWP